MNRPAFTLKRIATDDDGTYGVLLDGTKPFLCVLERPRRMNLPNRSCIPAGTYVCKRVISDKYKETFEVQDVEGRTFIRIHWGNTEIDSKGCLILGIGWGKLRAIDPDTNRTEDQAAVVHSRLAFEKFMSRLHGVDEFDLWILWV